MNNLKKYLVIITMVFVILTDNLCLAGDQQEDGETAKLKKELTEACEKDIFATFFTRPECKDNELYTQTRDVRPYIDYIAKYIDSNLFQVHQDDEVKEDDDEKVVEEKKKRRTRFDFIHFLINDVEVKATCDLNTVYKELHKDGDPEEYAENFKRVIEILDYKKQSKINEEAEASRATIREELAKAAEQKENAETPEAKAKATDMYNLIQSILENSNDTPTEQMFFFRKVYLEYVPDYLQHNKQLFKGEDLKFFESLDDNFKTQFNERLLAIALQCYTPPNTSSEYGKCPKYFCRRIVDYDIEKAAEMKRLVEKYKKNEGKSEM